MGSRRKSKPEFGPGAQDGSASRTLAVVSKLELFFGMISPKPAMSLQHFLFGKKERGAARAFFMGGGDLCGGTVQSHLIGSIVLTVGYFQAVLTQMEVARLDQELVAVAVL